MPDIQPYPIAEIKRNTDRLGTCDNLELSASVLGGKCGRPATVTWSVTSPTPGVDVSALRNALELASKAIENISTSGGASKQETE